MRHTFLVMDSTKKGLRAFKIWSIVLIVVVTIWWDSLQFSYLGGRTKKKIHERQSLRSRWLTNEFIKLGSAFIKLGQLLSARPDLLPASWIHELSNLQDKVPPFSFEKAQEILESELGARCAEIIDLDSEPLGAASLSQVHKASLRSGRQVVFKIQRPEIEKSFRLDLQVMEQVASLLQRNRKWSKGRDWVSISKECRRVLLREIDFTIEAQYAARFRQQFLDDPSIKVPSVIWELSTERVLCLDYLPGIKINDVNALNEQKINTSLIAEIAATSYFKQLIKFGFFHADPHPGNLAVTNKGELIYYDFGMMGLLSDNVRNKIGSMVRAAASKDATALIKEFQAAGLIATDIDIGPIRRLIRVMLKEALTPPFNSNIIDKLSGDLYELVYVQPFYLPVELIFVLRALSTLEGVGRSLDPRFNLIAILKPYLLTLMTNNSSSPNELINELGRQVGEFSSRAATLPKRLDESLEKLEQGDLQLQIRMGESDRQLRRIINTQQAIGQSILLGSFSIASALLGGSNKPIYAILPLLFCLPIGINIFKLQRRIRKAHRIDELSYRQK